MYVTLPESYCFGFSFNLLVVKFMFTMYEQTFKGGRTGRKMSRKTKRKKRKEEEKEGGRYQEKGYGRSKKKNITTNNTNKNIFSFLLNQSDYSNSKNRLRGSRETNSTDVFITTAQSWTV